MISKTLPFALFLAITSVFAVAAFVPIHQTQAQEHISLKLVPSNPNPNIGDAIVLRATTNAPVPENYAIRIYELVEITAYDENGEKYIVEEHWLVQSCDVFGEADSVDDLRAPPPPPECETYPDQVASNSAAVKTFSADISISSTIGTKLIRGNFETSTGIQRNYDYVKTAAESEPITVTWSIGSLYVNAIPVNAELDKSITITAKAQKTVSGTTSYIRIYDENGTKIELCVTSDTCSAEVASPNIGLQRTYTAVIAKDVKGQEVVQARGSVTVTWGESAVQTAPTASGGLVKCGIGKGKACTFCDFFALSNDILQWVIFVIVPAIALLFVVIGGFLLATSRGNPGQSQKGKDVIIWTFAGIVIISVGWMVLNSLLSGIGVMKWTGLTGETGKFETHFLDGRLYDQDRSGDKVWKDGDWNGFVIELNHPSFSEPKFRRIVNTSSNTITVDEPLFLDTQEGVGLEYKIGGWWQFSCGL